MKAFVGRDIDGFFGLFIDNLVQLLMILFFCTTLAGMSGEYAYLVDSRILPGAAISILVGNLFFAWQALRLAKRENRDDVTALPYGINTPSLLVYVFFVLAPLRDNPEQAWRMGMVACLGSGLIEFAGAFVAPFIRKSTPRAALLSTLSGIAIGFISMSFALDIWAKPVVTMASMAIVLVAYFSNIRFPWRLPGGFLAILVGSAIAWLPTLLHYLTGWPSPGATEVPMSLAAVRETAAATGWRPPIWSGWELWETLRDGASWMPYLSVIVPMGLFTVIGSLQNIESADAAGDRYSVRSSLAVNGLGTIVASLLGSCFPTTLYIGHPGWKQLGARSGYSSLNGIAITAICLSGTVPLIAAVIPKEAGFPIVLWIGVIITAQAFVATPARHAAAVAIGLFPAVAAWGATLVFGIFELPGVRDANITLQQVLTSVDVNSVLTNGFGLHGMIVLERGYIFTCMAISAIAAALIDRKFFVASVWSAMAVTLTVIGLAHAYSVTGNAVDYFLFWESDSSLPSGTIAYRAYDIAAGYLLMAMIFLGIGYYYEGEKRAGRAVDQDPSVSVTHPPR